MSGLDKQHVVMLNGERWVRISSPAGWKNEKTGETAGDAWIQRQLAQ